MGTKKKHWEQHIFFIELLSYVGRKGVFLQTDETCVSIHGKWGWLPLGIQTRLTLSAYKIWDQHLLFFFWKHKLKGAPGSQSGSLNLLRARLRSLHYLTGLCSRISIRREKENESIYFRSNRRKGLVGTSEGAMLSTTVVTNTTSHGSGDATAFSSRDTMLSRVRQD